MDKTCLAAHKETYQVTGLFVIIIFFYKDNLGDYFHLLKFHIFFPGAQALTVSHWDYIVIASQLQTHRAQIAAAYSLGCSSTMALSLSFSWFNSLPGFPCGVHLSHTVISHCPSEAHCKKALVSKNTLHIKVLYTHMHRPTHRHTCMHTAHTPKGSHRLQSAFPGTEITHPSLDPTHSCLLGEDLTKLPKTKTLGNKRWKGDGCQQPSEA